MSGCPLQNYKWGFSPFCVSVQKLSLCCKQRSARKKGEILKLAAERLCLKGLNVLDVQLLFDLISYKQVIPVRDDKF